MDIKSHEFKYVEKNEEVLDVSDVKSLGKNESFQKSGSIMSPSNKDYSPDKTKNSIDELKFK